MQKNRFNQRKVFIIVLGSLLLITAGLLVWRSYKYKKVNQEIKKLVTTKSHGLYKIDYTNIFIDEAAGTLQLKDVSILPDTNVYNERAINKKYPDLMFNIKIPQLTIAGVKSAKVLIDKEIVGKKIEILKPEIEIILTDAKEKITDTIELYKRILGDLKMIKVDMVEITQATLTIKDRKAHSVRFKGLNVSFLLQNFIIDSLHNKDSSRILFSENIVGISEKAWFETRSKKYTFNLSKVAFDSRKRKLTIGKIHIDPKLSEATFLRAAVKQTDRLDLIFEDVSLENINPRKLQEIIIADELIIGKSNFKIYRDLSYPHDKKNRIGTYPHQALMKLPVRVNFQKIVLRNAFIEYKEKNPLSNNSGKVQFYAANATITNVTNDSSAIAKNDICALDFNANFLNKVKINADLRMYLHHPEGKFSLTGSAGEINAEELNSICVPMAMLKIEKGIINSVNFNLTGNDNNSTGTLKMLYRDLKISLLEKEGKEYDKKNIKSLFANTRIKNKNPDDDEIRQVAIQHNRDPSRSFFNLIWKSIFAGLNKTVMK